LVGITLSHAQVTVGGSPSVRNVFEGGSQGAGFLDLDHSVVEFSYNDVEASSYPWAGILVGQGFQWIPQESSQILIRHNEIKVKGGYVDGIWAVDYGPPSGLGKTADFVIRDNTIQIASFEVDPAWAGIEALFLDGAVIANNRILGSSTVGIALEGASQCMVKGNNVNGLAADFVAIYFDSGTSNSTVVGSGKETNVYDEGINNTLVSVNNMKGNPPGPAIRDAMKRKMEIIKSIRRQ
jgi:parallel beta-helix repeat protein